MLITPDQLNDFIKMNTGKWFLEFQEIYHPDDVFWPLCEISFDPLSLGGSTESLPRNKNAFKISRSMAYSDTKFNETAEKRFSDSEKGLNEWRASFAKEMENGLSNVLVRCGILRPAFESEAIEELSGSHGSIIIPDTNSVVNGAFHYICRTYSENIGYVAFPENVEQELRSKANDFKKKTDRILKITGNNEKPKKNDATEILRHRAFGQNAFDALRHNKLAVEYEIAPIQTSSFKAAGGDEEIIRTMAEFLRSRHTSAPIYFLTYDYNMARFCNLRGWKVIFCRQPKINSGQSPYSVRYDYRKEQFVIIDVAEFLWEAAYAFNCLKIISEDHSKTVFLHSCKKGVNYRNWIENRMHISVLSNQDSEMSEKFFRVSLNKFLKGVFGYFKEDALISLPSWSQYLEVGYDTAKEYLLFGSHLGLWEIKDNQQVKPNPKLNDFINSWRKDGLTPIVEELRLSYPVFAKFCAILSKKGEIRLDDHELMKSAGLQVRVLNYFPKMLELLNLGRSMDKRLVWTGEESTPEEFWTFLKNAYGKTSGSRKFVGIAELINAGYFDLHISHDTFRIHFSRLMNLKPDMIEASGSISIASDRRNSFSVIRPLDTDGYLEKINLEDGFVIASRTIKAIRIKG